MEKYMMGARGLEPLTLQCQGKNIVGCSVILWHLARSCGIQSAQFATVGQHLGQQRREQRQGHKPPRLVHGDENLDGVLREIGNRHDAGTLTRGCDNKSILCVARRNCCDLFIRRRSRPQA